jgi:hypothetical protein
LGTHVQRALLHGANACVDSIIENVALDKGVNFEIMFLLHFCCGEVPFEVFLFYFSTRLARHET